MKRLLLGLFLMLLAVLAALFGVRQLDARGITAPRLAAYIDGRAQGHNGAVIWIGDALQSVLYATVAAPPAMPDVALWPVGAATVSTPAIDTAATASVTVADTAALRSALAAARGGDVIALLAGVYRVDGAPLALSRDGSAAAPITVRGPPAGQGVAELQIDVAEGLLVTAPYWRVEGLTVRGVCASDGDCEHAFHVVGGGNHFSAVGNTVQDFNAHFKINGSGGRFPDGGLIERNTINNTAVRRTDNPVTPIDLVAASGWVIRRNLISDFIKGGGDQISFGAYAKGAGADNQFIHNVVWCERLLRHQPGARVGLSFGGGGSGPAYCRDGKCVVEQEGGVMESNLVAACSDDGIYLNNAARTTVANNSVLGTNGISVRFAGSTAVLSGNLSDGPVRNRDGALVRAEDNISAPGGWGLFGGSLSAPLLSPPRRLVPGVSLPVDLCGAVRGRSVAYGAIDQLAACGSAAQP